MIIFRLFSVTLVFGAPLCADIIVPPLLLIADSNDAEQELSQIDSELDQLKDMKNKYKASEARNIDKATRWQFQQNMKQESKRAYQQADLDRQMQEQIQTRIDYLQNRKAEILKENPEANVPSKSS